MAWGIYQTIGKQRREVQIEALQSELHKAELQDRIYASKPNVSVAYVETGLGDLLTYTFGAAAYFQIPQMAKEPFRDALLAWRDELTQRLPFSVRLSIADSNVLDELYAYMETKAPDVGHDNRLVFLLVRNEGKYPAKDVVVKFRDARIVEPDRVLGLQLPVRPVAIDSLNSNEAAVILLTHYRKDGSRIGLELTPDGPLVFTDAFTLNRHELVAREPYDSARIVAKGLLLRG